MNRADKELDVERGGFDEIAPGIYVYMTGNTGPNSMAIVSGGEVMLVDALMTSTQSEGLKKALREVTDAPVTKLAYSHRHGDHILGASVFGDIPAVFGSPSTVDFLRTVGDDYMEIYAQWRRTPEDAAEVRAIPNVVKANIAVENTLEVWAGDVRVRLLRQELGHSPSDMLIYLPDHGILCTGDVYAPRIVPGMRDGRASGWLTRLQEIYDMDAKIIVPGHGPWSSDRYFVGELRDFLATAWDATQAGIAAGKTPEEITTGIDQSEWSVFRGMQQRYHEVIARMFAELEDEPSKYDQELEKARTRRASEQA